MSDSSSIYNESYAWIKESLDQSPEAGLIAISTKVSELVHCRKMMSDKDIISILCAIRNSIWDWETKK